MVTPFRCKVFVCIRSSNTDYSREQLRLRQEKRRANNFTHKKIEHKWLGHVPGQPRSSCTSRARSLASVDLAQTVISIHTCRKSSQHIQKVPSKSSGLCPRARCTASNSTKKATKLIGTCMPIEKIVQAQGDDLLGRNGLPSERAFSS